MCLIALGTGACQIFNKPTCSSFGFVDGSITPIKSGEATVGINVNRTAGLESISGVPNVFIIEKGLKTYESQDGEINEGQWETVVSTDPEIKSKSEVRAPFPPSVDSELPNTMETCEDSFGFHIER